MYRSPATYTFEESIEENGPYINEFLTPREVMDLLDIGRNTFYRLANSGELPAFRIGKKWRVRKDDLKSWHQSLQYDAHFQNPKICI